MQKSAYKEQNEMHLTLQILNQQFICRNCMECATRVYYRILSFEMILRH